MLKIDPIELEYEIGQEVFFIKKYVFDDTCGGCEGEGQIELKNGEGVDCPKCKGEGKFGEILAFVVESGKVTDVYIHVGGVWKDQQTLEPLIKIDYRIWTCVNMSGKDKKGQTFEKGNLGPEHPKYFWATKEEAQESLEENQLVETTKEKLEHYKETYGKPRYF